jgi:hypothetical protein
MRSLNKFIAISGSIALTCAALTTSAHAQSQSEQGAVMGRVISSTPLVQPNHSQPTAYNVVYEYAGKHYNVQMPRDPGGFVQLQVTPVGEQQAQQQMQQFEQPVSIPVPVIQPQVVYAPQPVVYQQPYYVNSYVNPYIYPAIGIGLGYAAYRGGYFAHRGPVVYRGGGGHRRH